MSPAKGRVWPAHGGSGTGLGMSHREERRMHSMSPAVLLSAGVVVTLAYFVLVAYLARALKSAHRLPVVIGALTGLVGALPAILYALYSALKVIA